MIETTGNTRITDVTARRMAGETEGAKLSEDFFIFLGDFVCFGAFAYVLLGLRGRGGREEGTGGREGGTEGG